MKKTIRSLLLALALCLSLSISVCAAYETVPLVYDEADLLSTREEERLQEKLQAVSDRCSAQILVATIPSADGADVDYLPDAIYDGMNFGYGPSRDGVILLVCMDPREYRIMSNGYAGDAISGREISAIGSAIVSDLSGGNYAAAFEEYADLCGYYLEGYRSGFPFQAGTSLLIALAVGLIAGLITVLVMKSQLKSIRPRNQANDYVKSGSMRLTGSSDIFLYRNVSRTRIQSSSSSGSRGGGSRSRGGGSF